MSPGSSLAVFLPPFRFNTKPVVFDMAPEIDTDCLLERELLEEQKKTPERWEFGFRRASFP